MPSDLCAQAFLVESTLTTGNTKRNTNARQMLHSTPAIPILLHHGSPTVLKQFFKVLQNHIQ